nr:reverse transcriptase domain-containing protein [Tanacetum cinerariifolium]
MPMLPTIKGVMGRVRKLLVMSAGHKDISKGTNPDANTVTGTFLLNNCYASVLFDTGADRSFISTVFSSQFDIAPTIFGHDYAVELADGRIVGVNTVICSCTLNFLNHQFNIDLMPVEVGSFDVIIGMDWLSRYQAIIVCLDKIVRIPLGRETLIFHGDGSNQEHETRLNIISCAKTHNFREYKNGDIPFRNRLFPEKIGYDVKIIDLFALFYDEEKFSKLSDEDAIRLCLLLSLEVIFMWRDLVSLVDDVYLRIVNDLDA